METVPEPIAAELFREHLHAQARHARERLQPLPSWEVIPQRIHRVSSATANHVRACRVLDYVLAGERIVDVGTNYGYLSAVLMRDRSPSHYGGFDLSQHQIDSVAAVARELDIEPPSFALELGNIYDLTPEVLAPHAPDLVLLCEVLEHLPDAESALTRLSGAVSRGTPILFTVPLFGRHDTCWGHRSVFDTVRVRQMCDVAELEVLHVEVVYNAWLFVLASRGAAETERRLSSLEAEDWPSFVSPRVSKHKIEQVSADAFAASSRWCRSLKDGPEPDRSADAAFAVRGRADRRRRTSCVGIRMTTAPFRLLRLELQIAGAGVDAIYIDVIDAGGDRIARWRWSNGEDLSIGDRPFTVVVREGSDAGPLREVESGHLADAAEVELFAELASGTTASLATRRAAVLPA